MKRRRQVSSNGAPFIVPCPAHVQKYIRKNLTRALHDRISLSRRKRAEEILSAIHKRERKRTSSSAPKIVNAANPTLEVTKRT
ncbi:hypothetical protein ACFL5F_03270 [Planctomycetota bacterium]